MIENRDEELRARLALMLARKIGPLAATRLVRYFGSIGEALDMPPGGAAQIEGVTTAKMKAAGECLKSGAVEAELEACEKLGVRLMMLGDDDYPPLLREIPDPPLLLWVRGTIEAVDHIPVGIVGSRSATYYGARQAAYFAEQLAARRVTVVSGLARGIDTAAHRAALDSGGRTVAVVGSGLANLYPPENERMATEIVGSGALISEFPLKTPGHPRNFPQRNRIISGMSLGVVVAQADLRSGSLITARLASEQGREVFAVPGKIDDEDYRGCHSLIKNGAKLADCVDDVLNELHGLEALPREGKKRTRKPTPEQATTSVERALLALLKPSDPVNVEELIRESGIPADQASAALMMMEMRGIIRQLAGRNYVLS